MNEKKYMWHPAPPGSPIVVTSEFLILYYFWKPVL